MASFFRLLPVALVLLVAAVTGEQTDGPAHYCRVFCFGASLSDTGNMAILPGAPKFDRPNGRACDGRLVIDFIVESLRLPQPIPYLAGSTADDFRDGVNFAVGGATALDTAFLKSKGLEWSVPISLGNQTTWLNGVLQLLASSRKGVKEQRKMMASTLFILGEIGFNDYSSVFFNNVLNVDAALELVESLVPLVIGAIRSALNDLIAAGARIVVVTGMIPMGCEPELLTLLPAAGGGHDEYYDPASGCITRLNQLAELHNRALNRMLLQLRRAHPDTFIHYSDLYSPITEIISSPEKYGFGSTPLTACCGSGGGRYNFNFTFLCGTPLARTCADPSRFVSWDGIHYTEAANKFVAHDMLRGLKANVWNQLIRSGHVSRGIQQ